jgi:chromosome segregation ATPase
MTELEQQLKRINDKVQQLLKHRELLQKENEKLKGELHQLQGRHTGNTAQLEQLLQQVEILKASKGELSDTEKKAFEKRLNQYIKEIDHCITLLKE